MTAKLVINYADEEINAMIDTLNLLSVIIENKNQEARTTDMISQANGAFEDLASLLCMDPKGERAFHANGY